MKCSFLVCAKAQKEVEPRKICSISVKDIQSNIFNDVAWYLKEMVAQVNYKKVEDIQTYPIEEQKIHRLLELLVSLRATATNLTLTNEG